MEAIRTYDSQCGSRCGIICYVKDGVFVKVEKDPDHPNGGICPKGMAAPQLVYNPDRLKYPMKRTRPKGDPVPGWVRISWEEALDTVVTRLKDIKSKYGPESVFFYRGAFGGTPSGDYSPWLTRFANLFGSPNIAATTHICNWHRDNGSMYTYGVGLPPPDFEKTACILICGHNPYATRRTHVQEIKAAKSRGAKLIVIDPRLTEIASEADLWVPVRPGTDGALALSMINVIITEGLYDKDFVRDWTNGPFLVRSDDGNFLTLKDISFQGNPNTYMVWDMERGGPIGYDPTTTAYQEPGIVPALTGSYRVEVENSGSIECKTAFQLLTELASQYIPEKAEEITWASAKQIRKAARIFATIKPACYFPYNGLEQHTNAMQTNRAICILYALTGNFDTEGDNCIFPKVPLNPIIGNEFLPPDKRRKRLGLAERPLGPASTGAIQAYEVYKAIVTGKPYSIKAFVSIGGNILMANGDSRKGRKALKQLEFYVQADLFETPAAKLADIVLCGQL